MRRDARIDDNHGLIRDFFRKAGAHWEDTFQQKNFCDGMLVYRGVTVAVEIKDGSKPPSQQRLTEGEKRFSERWTAHGGKYAVIRSLEDAQGLLNSIRGRLNDATPGEWDEACKGVRS